MLKLLIIAAFFLSAVGCASMEQETDIPVDQVPDVVLKAAQAALPGFVVESAEIETEDGIQTYELEGTSGGKEYEIEISTSGEVLEIEEIE